MTTVDLDATDIEQGQKDADDERRFNEWLRNPVGLDHVAQCGGGGVPPVEAIAYLVELGLEAGELADHYAGSVQMWLRNLHEVAEGGHRRREEARRRSMRWREEDRIPF